MELSFTMTLHKNYNGIPINHFNIVYINNNKHSTILLNIIENFRKKDIFISHSIINNDLHIRFGDFSAQDILL